MFRVASMNVAFPPFTPAMPVIPGKLFAVNVIFGCEVLAPPLPSLTLTTTKFGPASYPRIPPGSN